jgi:TRAP-type uncharacterized transport system substrate-binding protein
METFEGAVTTVTEVTSQKPRARHLIFVIAVTVAVAVFQYVVHVYDPNLDPVGQIWRGVAKENYKFFTGGEGGFYIRMGRALDDLTSRGQTPIQIQNQPTSGGKQNVQEVVTTPRSFGLVQEDTLQNIGFMSEQVRQVSPLYIERLHILYDRSDVVSSESDSRPIVLNRKKDKRFVDLLHEQPVSLGPVGSGSRVVAAYLLDHLQIEAPNDVGASFGKGLEMLKNDELSVIFTIAGAPLPGIVDMLEVLDEDGQPRYGLISVDPAIVPGMNKEYGLQLRSVVFGDRYPGQGNVTGIGSWCFLIASQDVPDTAILDFLGLLREASDDLRQDIGVHSGGEFQLSEFSYYESFADRHASHFMATLKALFVFFVTTVFTSAVILVFLSWAISGIRKARLLRQMTLIYRQHLPENMTLDWRRGPLPTPVIFPNQSAILANLVEGTSQLIVLTGDVRAAYDRGEITMSHHDHLLASIQDLRQVFRLHLARRLNEFLGGGGNLGRVRLRNYYTAGYLVQKDYLDLAARYPHEDENGFRDEILIPSAPPATEPRTPRPAPSEDAATTDGGPLD